MNSRHVLRCAAALLITLPLSAQADLFDVVGDVTTSTGALATLTPPGTPAGGLVEIDSAAVAGGAAGVADVISIAVNVGGFCVPYVALDCPSGGANVPITSIDSAALTFSPGQDVGGSLSLTVFSPTFQVEGLVFFDFDAGTFSVDTQLGLVAGNITMSPQVVPIPAAVWLFGTALAGLGFARRKR